MKSILSVLLFTTLFASMQGIAQSKQNANLEEAKKAIAASNAIYGSLIAKNDGSILNLYAEDAWIMPPNSPIIKDREAQMNFFKEAYNAGVRSGTFITTEVFGDGKEFVTEVGLVKIYDGNGKQMVDDKYLVLWKKTKNGWKMFRDMFSSLHPAQ